MDQLTFTPASLLAKAIREKAVSVKEVVQAHLNQINAVNPAINALVQSTAASALAEAGAADAAIARGDALGPLHGVPFTVKDNIETKGIVCACGTTGLAQNIPTEDAIVVSRIRAAGGILLGKTNLPEVGLGYETDNLIYGRSNNPYDLSRTTGGSSGGEAALIAAGGSPLGLATDGGGSARWPAHCCGIVGIKPTTGRTAKIGHVPPPGGVINPFWQMSLMARSVADLSLALPLICGPDPRDPSAVPVPFPELGKMDLGQSQKQLAPRDRTLAHRFFEKGATAVRVAVFTDNGIVSPTPRIAQMVNQCADSLAQAGAIVSQVCPPMIGEAHPIYVHLLSADGGVGLGELLKSWGTREAHPNTKKVQVAQQQHQLTAGEFGGWLYELDQFRQRMSIFMTDYDAILCPVAPLPAVAHGNTMPNPTYAGFDPMFSYLVPFNLTGWPCGTVRAGTSPEGLPLGIQVAANAWREDIVLALLAFLEAEHGGWQPPA
ncbi:MAG: amidase [Chloroflexota bacterium]